MRSVLAVALAVTTLCQHANANVLPLEVRSIPRIYQTEMLCGNRKMVCVNRHITADLICEPRLLMFITKNQTVIDTSGNYKLTGLRRLSGHLESPLLGTFCWGLIWSDGFGKPCWLGFTEQQITKFLLTTSWMAIRRIEGENFAEHHDVESRCLANIFEFTTQPENNFGAFLFNWSINSNAIDYDGTRIIFSDGCSNSHLLQLFAHKAALCLYGENSVVGFTESSKGVRVLLPTASPHFNEHTEVDGCECQRSQRQKDGSISGASVMITAAPPLSRPGQAAPGQPNNHVEAITVIIATVALCAVCMWFGAAALFIGIDHGSPLLIFWGIPAIAVQALAIIYIIDFYFL